MIEEAETSAVEALLYARGFAHSLTQIKKLRSSYFTSAFNLNGCNLWTVNQKDSFNSYSLKNSSYCNCLMNSSMSLCYYNTLVGLNSLLIALTYPYPSTPKTMFTELVEPEELEPKGKPLLFANPRNCPWFNRLKNYWVILCLESSSMISLIVTRLQKWCPPGRKFRKNATVDSASRYPSDHGDAGEPYHHGKRMSFSCFSTIENF